MKYRKKPVVIEAIEFHDGGFYPEVMKFCKGVDVQMQLNQDLKARLLIPTLEGVMIADQGDWIIKGVKGEFYPIKNEIFLLTYEAVESIQERQHLESSDCWCGPTLIQAIDDEHDCEVWSHKGHEELNQ